MFVATYNYKCSLADATQCDSHNIYNVISKERERETDRQRQRQTYRQTERDLSNDIINLEIKLYTRVYIMKARIRKGKKCDRPMITRVRFY